MNMKQITLRIFIALSTFLVGITIATAWVAQSRTVNSDDIPPVSLAAETGPNASDERPSLEMVFVLDTTGSMSGLLEGAKERIWGIVNEVMQSQSHPSVRIGLVAYRDHGDTYITKVTPLTSNLDAVYTDLMNLQAAGGGDEPEDVRSALADGVSRAGWSQPSQHLAQIIFLVGDAPPHNDYQNEPDTLTTAAEAVHRGMIVNTIQCGQQANTKIAWEEIARRGQGQYFAIAQDGGVQAISTPYDARLSELGSKMGSTYIAYGGGAGTAGDAKRNEDAAKIASTETTVATSAPVAAKADRALNKALNREAYEGDLLQAIENGTVKEDAIKDDELPADLRKLSPEQRKQEIEKRLSERKAMRDEILSLSKQRSEFIEAERKKQSAGKQGGFDAAVASALKEQLARRGIK